MEWNRFVSELNEQSVRFFIKRNQHRDLLALNEMKLLCDGAILEMKRQLGILIEPVITTNIFRVPTRPIWRMMLQVVEGKKLSDGIEAQRFLLQRKNLLRNLSRFAEVSLGALMLRLEQVKFANW